MSWIQENKFVAGLIGVTTVLGGAMLYFGISQGAEYSEKLEAYEGLKANYVSLQKATPYPEAENLEGRKKGVELYQKTIDEMVGALEVYRPDKMLKVTPEQFGDDRVKMRDELREKFKAVGATLPDSTDFGFERYASSAAKSVATPELEYELGATEWLLSKLADVKPDALINVVRKPLLIEDGKKPEAAGAKGKKKGKKKGKSSAKPTDGKIYQLMPMELAFTASEESVRHFLKEMVNSKKYFYAIRSMRVLNEKQTAPTERDASFPTKEVEEDSILTGFEGLEQGDADEEFVDSAPVVSELILKRVLGAEKLHVHIAFDIVLFEAKGPVADSTTDAK